MADEDKKSLSVTDCLKNLRYAMKVSRDFFEKYKEDLEAALGEQWDEKDAETLRKRGVEPLTINKIRPIIKLITGIERQSRSDLIAFPEGQEDSIKAEIATRLMKNVMKKSSGQNKLSAQFKSGVTGGACFLEPYVDYSFDLINGEMKFKKVSATRVLYDPDAEEYDLSDAKYVIKLSRKLTKDQLLELFPDKKKDVEKIEHAKFMFDENGSLTSIQFKDYQDQEFDEKDDTEQHEGEYDLAEYYYKDKTKKYYVASKVDGTLIEVDSKDEADAYLANLSSKLGIQATQQGQQMPPDSVVIIEKEVPQIRRKAFVGATELDDDVAWSYPKWKGYPLIPYFAEWNVEEDVDRDLLIQGIVRSLRSLQFEYNKRRTQELNHINASINSGSFIPKGALDKPNMDKMKTYGSTPGIIIEYDAEKAAGTTPEGWKVRPAPLSQGHAQLAMENAQDIKEASGVNSDLLANDSTDQSGKAILLKQRQGLVMVQEQLDNYGETKKILGKFILSQLGELFTVETAVKVLGDAWVNQQDVFKEPVFDQATNQPTLGQDGNLRLQLNPGLVGQVINEVLNDSSLGKYDITIGEGAYTETSRIANHMMLMDMAKSGIPIPPDILVSESNLPESTKAKILAAVEAARRAAEMNPAPVPMPKPKGKIA